MRDLASNIKIFQSLTPAVRTSVSATAVDTRGYDSVVIELSIGTCTDGSFAFKLQESNSENSDYTDVVAGDLNGSFPTVAVDESPDAYSHASSVHKVGYIGSKRYVKIAATVTGSPGTGIACGCNAILGHGHVKPQSINA